MSEELRDKDQGIVDSFQHSDVVEVGFFVPPAEDSSIVVLNRLATQITNATNNINMVIYRVAQPEDPRIAASRRLQKKSYVHGQVLEDEVFPLQREVGLAGVPKGTLLCPELLAEKYEGRIRIEDVPNPNDPTFVAQIAANERMKLAFSIRNLVIFRSAIIDTFERKMNHSLINLHPARLIGLRDNTQPHYRGIRGLEGPFWTRMLAQSEYQTTMHVIDQGIDTGPILDYRAQPVNGDAHKPTSVYPREAAKDVAHMIFQQIHLRLIQGAYRPPIDENNVKESSLHSRPTDMELDYGENMGIRFVDGSDQLNWIIEHFGNFQQYAHASADMKRSEEYQRAEEFNKVLSESVWGGYFSAGFGSKRKRKGPSADPTSTPPVNNPPPATSAMSMPPAISTRKAMGTQVVVVSGVPAEFTADPG